ncbi:MAG: spore coat protein CotJB [Ruminococcaceae bacterium]|nr:spore coat protein CotJB [Oscillospiraceae bacterium]
MSSKEMLLKKLSSYKFAVHELKLFLDTHPKDKETMKKLKEYEEKARELSDEYEEKYGPVKRKNNNTEYWSWVNDPWPWEAQ